MAGVIVAFCAKTKQIPVFGNEAIKGRAVERFSEHEYHVSLTTEIVHEFSEARGKWPSDLASSVVA